MKTTKYLTLLGIISLPAQAGSSAYFSHGLEMDQVSLLRLHALNIVYNDYEDRYRTAYPILSFAFDGINQLSDGVSPSLSFLYGPVRLLFDVSKDCRPCEIAYWALSPLGTMFHYQPGGSENLYRSRTTGMTGSLYIKSNVDIFPFNKHPWVKFTPGLGVGFRRANFNVVPTAFDLAIAYIHGFEHVFEGKWVHNPGINLSISYSGN